MHTEINHDHAAQLETHQRDCFKNLKMKCECEEPCECPDIPTSQAPSATEGKKPVNRVLVVEDNMLNQKIIESMLLRLGYIVWHRLFLISFSLIMIAALGFCGWKWFGGN